MNTYFCFADGRSNGPYHPEELIARGITRHTLVWTEGLADWCEAQHVEELKTLLDQARSPATPPPLPTLRVDATIRKPPTPPLSERKKVQIAREIRNIFYMLLIALGLGGAVFSGTFNEEPVTDREKRATTAAIWAFIASATALILGRYVWKAATWVNDTSKREIDESHEDRQEVPD